MRDLDQYRTSSFCASGGCVGVAADAESVEVVHTASSTGTVLRFTRAEWAAFVAGVRNGEFDLD